MLKQIEHSSYFTTKMSHMNARNFSHDSKIYDTFMRERLNLWHLRDAWQMQRDGAKIVVRCVIKQDGDHGYLISYYLLSWVMRPNNIYVS